MLQILAIGDIVGTRTLDALRERLWKKRDELGVDLVIANGENATDIHGIGSRDAQLLLDCGEVSIEGKVFALVYDEERENGRFGFLRRKGSFLWKYPWHSSFG